MSLRLLTWSTLSTMFLGLACSQAAQPDTRGSIAVVVENTGSSALGLDSGELEISGLDQDVYQRVALPAGGGELRVALRPGTYQVAWNPLPNAQGSSNEQPALRPASGSQVLLVAPRGVTKVNVRLLAPLSSDGGLTTAANDANDDRPIL